MNREQIFEKTKEILVDKLGIDEKVVTEDATLVGYDPDDEVVGGEKDTILGIDSLDLVELIMEFEREFGIYIPDGEIEEGMSVGQIIDGVQRLMKKEDKK